MKHKLILITDYYPYTQNETFLENEIPYLASNFDLQIITNDIISEKCRILPDGVKLYRCTGQSGYTIFQQLRLLFMYVTSYDGLFEIFSILKIRKTIINRLSASFYYFMQAQTYFERLVRLGIINTEDNQIIYSYWSSYRLLGITHNAKKLKNTKIVTRLHGYDLYNERMTDGRQPFKPQMERHLSKVLLIAEYCKQYYLEKFCKDSSKVVVQRLGTIQNDSLTYRTKDEIFLIVSCSNVIPLKRVHLIAEAVLKLKMRVKWVHFGDGTCMEQIRTMTNILPDNITIEFKGRIPNEEVMTYYKSNDVDCFVTTSETEGCPVSIMEALSFGIPIIATKVGGIPEMLNDTGNILLDSSPSVEQVVDAFLKIYNLNNSGQKRLFEDNIVRWNQYYNASKNNSELVKLLQNLQIFSDTYGEKNL